MAEQIITSYTSKGLFNPVKINYTKLNSDLESAEFSTDLTNCKDSVIAIIDIPASIGGGFTFRLKSVSGGKDIVVDLISEVVNVVRFTTMDVKDADGFGHFVFTTDSGMTVNDHSVRVAFIKCLDVENH